MGGHGDRKVEVIPRAPAERRIEELEGTLGHFDTPRPEEREALRAARDALGALLNAADAENNGDREDRERYWIEGIDQAASAFPRVCAALSKHGSEG